MTFSLKGMAAAALAAALTCATGICQAQAWHWYNDNPDFKPSTLPNGSVVNFSAWQKVLPYTRLDGKPARAQVVADRVWMISGYFYGPVIVETARGLLVFSSGENADEGKIFRDIIRRDVSSKPIIALFYDHAHYAKGARTLLDGDPAMIVAHPDSNRILRESGYLSNPTIPEMLPALDGRARVHFASDLPATGPDAKLGGSSLDLGKQSAWMPATHTLADGESITVDGLDIQAFHAVTDTEDSLTFWLPKQKIVIDNVLWPTVPNLYTLRGDRYRDPTLWISALKKIRDLEPEVELNVGAGAKALYGKAAIRDASNALIDASSFIYDQSIRLTNQGVRMQELRHHIEMPASLLKHPYVNEGYGQFDSWPEAIAVRSQGWFSGHVEDLHTLPRAQSSRQWMALAGGEKAVLKAYRSAMADKKYLWAKDLAISLYDVAPGNPSYRQGLADVFRALGRYSPGSIPRHFYLSAALSLEGAAGIVRTTVQGTDWVMADLPRAVDHLRTRLDPAKSAGQEGMLLFEIGEQKMALHVRNSVAEFIAKPEKHYRRPDAAIRVSALQFARYFRGEINALALLDGAGADAAARALLTLFDDYQEAPMYPAH